MYLKHWVGLWNQNYLTPKSSAFLIMKGKKHEHKRVIFESDKNCSKNITTKSHTKLSFIWESVFEYNSVLRRDDTKYLLFTCFALVSCYTVSNFFLLSKCRNSYRPSHSFYSWPLFLFWIGYRHPWVSWNSIIEIIFTPFYYTYNFLILHSSHILSGSS